MNEVELMELIFLGLLAKGCYGNNELQPAKEYYLHFLEYFNSENWKMDDPKWMNYELQNQREVKIGTSLKCRELCKKYKDITIKDLLEWVRIEKNEIMELLKDWLMVFVIYALQDLYMIDLEVQMQELHAKAPPNTPVDPSPIRMATSGPVLSQQGKLLRPFTLLGKNQRDIFKPSHNLPTMTIEEYIDEEIERGGIIVDKPDSVIDLKDLGYALDDDQNWVEIENQRKKDTEWDAFKDDNPRGHGNRIGKG